MEYIITFPVNPTRMEKVDLSKELMEVYTAKKTPKLVDIPEGKFLAIMGEGDPNGKEYQHAIQVLYGITYAFEVSLQRTGKRLQG
ncbi:hypothetical protein GF319_04655 [Candidatus Bathyarchaeota archaeon]|nr:hypothetical protein [Candidatus Bathyarchaeota archaeon]